MIDLRRVLHRACYRNMRANIRRVSRRVKPMGPHDRTCILVCYGPSLKDTWQDIGPETGDVVTVSAAHDFMVDVGVVPCLHVDSDPRPHKAKHIRKAQSATGYLLASCVHPDLIARVLGDNLALWHALNGVDSADRLAKLEPGAIGVLGGSSVGLRAIVLMYMVGYRKFDIHGMDCSFADDGATQWAGPHAGRHKAVLPILCGGFHTSGLLIDYAHEYFQTLARMPDAKFTLNGHGLLQDMAARRQPKINKAKLEHAA